MGILGKKKKKEEELPVEEEEDTSDYDEKIAELNAKIAALGKKADKAVAKKEVQPKGKFSLDDGEMALAVQALAERPELKVFNDFIIGQKIASIIQSYNEAVGETTKDGIQSSEDTDEELPTE